MNTDKPLFSLFLTVIAAALPAAGLFSMIAYTRGGFTLPAAILAFVAVFCFFTLPAWHWFNQIQKGRE